MPTQSETNSPLSPSHPIARPTGVPSRQQLGPGATRRRQARGTAWLALAALGSVCACGSETHDDTEADGGSIFGGSGGSGDGGGGSSGDGGSARCANIASSAEYPKIDNLDDGNALTLPAPDRSGSWFVSADPSGGTVTPSVFESVAGGPGKSRLAARIQAADFTDWGVALGVAVRWQGDGIQCPYNASAFKGLSFWAKGPESGKQLIWVSVPLAATTPAANGGTCDEAKATCWDAPRAPIELSPGWQRYTLTWDEFAQAGWGTFAATDPKTILGFSWAAYVADLPADFWVDDVSFYAGEDGGSGGSSGAGGTGGQGGAAGQAGESNGAEAR